MLDLDPLALLPERARPARGGAPRVGLVGYYGWGNYGDELFLEVFRAALEPGVALDLVLDPRRRPALPRHLDRQVRNRDAILIGGGDIVVPWSWTPYWERAYLRRPVFVAGVGVPDWRPAEKRTVDRLRRVFGHANVRLVTTRDEESSRWVREHLGPAVPVVTSPDLVCALSLPVVERPADPPIFGVVVRRRKTLDDLGQVRRTCLRAMELGYRVRRIVLATAGTRTADLEATEGLGLSDTELVASDDLEVLTRAIGECSALASMKFHGVVVATMFGIPAFVLMPTAKNRRFMARIDRPDLISAYNDAELPDRLSRDPTPIPVATRRELSGAASDLLADLRERIAAV